METYWNVYSAVDRDNLGKENSSKMSVLILEQFQTLVRLQGSLLKTTFWKELRRLWGQHLRLKLRPLPRKGV